MFLWMSFGCGCRRAHIVGTLPAGKGLVVDVGGLSFPVIVVIVMIADKADVDRSKKGKDEGLD
jgi:hypothetical protein